MQIFKTYIIIAIGAFFAINIHEFSKAFTSYKMGDKAIKNKGDLYLNPFKRIDPLGFLFILFTWYGWGRPSDTDSFYYKNRKVGTIIVYTVSILFNILFAFIFFNLEKFWAGFYVIGRVNLCMAVFNLIPIYPLSAYKILKVTLSPNAAVKFSQFEKLIQILVILFIFMGPLLVALNFVTGILESILNSLVFIR